MMVRSIYVFLQLYNSSLSPTQASDDLQLAECRSGSLALLRFL